MLEYGYMLALNKPPALVRMDPLQRKGMAVLFGSVA